MPEKNEFLPLSYELIYRRYLINRGKGAGLFTELTRSEYIALHILINHSVDQTVLTHKTYLWELSEEMQASIYAVSNMISNLKRRGFVKWSHDGTGEDGTYVIVTDSGLRAMERQEAILKTYYDQVIEQFGQDRLKSLLKEMKQLDLVMDQIYDTEGDTQDEKDQLD